MRSLFFSRTKKPPEHNSITELQSHLAHHVNEEGGFCATLDAQIQELLEKLAAHQRHARLCCPNHAAQLDRE